MYVVACKSSKGKKEIEAKSQKIKQKKKESKKHMKVQGSVPSIMTYFREAPKECSAPSTFPVRLAFSIVPFKNSSKSGHMSPDTKTNFLYAKKD